MATVKPQLRDTETYTESNFLRLHTRSEPGRGSLSGLTIVTLEHLAYRPRPAERGGGRGDGGGGRGDGGGARDGGCGRAGGDGGDGGAGGGWTCATIVDGEPMSKHDALFIARAYARENGIPVIYESHDS